MEHNHGYIFKPYFLSHLLFSFFMEFMPVYPVYMILFSERGYDFAGISWLMIIWSAPVVFLELPSGILADRWSRKGLLIVGMAFKALCFLLWVLSPSYLVAALGFVSWGIQEAFCSGSRQALLYETLREAGEEEDYENAAGICNAVSTLGIILALASGGFFFVMNDSLPAILSMGTSLIAMVMAVSLTEPRGHTPPEKTEQPSGTSSAFRALRGFRTLMIAVFLAGGAYGLVEEYDGLWAAESFRIPVAFVGLWVALRFSFEGLGGIVAGRISSFMNRIGSLGFAVALVISGFFFFISTFLPVPVSITFYLAYYFCMSILTIILEGKLNRAVEDSGRATLLSISSLGVTLTAMLLSPLFGFAADTMGFQWLIRLSGITGIISGVVLVSKSGIKKIFSKHRSRLKKESI